MAGMDRPVTRFVQSGDAQIAYQVFGEGPDLLVIAGGPSHLEMRWHQASSARFYTELATFSRVIIFDKRGAGLSDRAKELPPLADQMGDVAAVLHAARSDSAFVHGYLDGGALATLFA